MKIHLIVVGKTKAQYLKTGEAEYLNRLKHYCRFEYTVIPDIKGVQKRSQKEQKDREGEAVLKNIDHQAYCVLLDEHGKEQTSNALAKMIEKHQIQATQSLVFIVGGAYGFSDQVTARAQQKIRLSSMTFSHEMVRLFFLEQVYRAYTILKGEPYHNE